MHEHSYLGCEHELKHCKHCDVVYCEKCKREWKQQASIMNNPWASKGPNTPYWWNGQLQQQFQNKPDVILCQHGI